MGPLGAVFGGIGVVAGLIGDAIGAGDEARARQLREQLAEEYGELALPELDKLVAQELPPDAAARYERTTKATRGTDLALDSLSKLIREGGETDLERADYLRSRAETARKVSGAQGAVDRSIRSRGLEGSGIELALKQQAGQNAVEMGAQADADNAARAQARRTQAISTLAGASNAARGQELNAMGAVDAIGRFNAQQRAMVNEYNARLPQQNFENAMAKLRGKAGALGAVADDAERRAARARAQGAGYGAAIAGFGEGFDEYFGTSSTRDGEETNSERETKRKRPSWAASAVANDGSNRRGWGW